MKGISFNVTLSNEQIEEIASQATDKVNFTAKINMGNDSYYKSEIERLEYQLRERDRIITQKEIERDRFLTVLRRHKDIIKKYEEKHGKLD